VVVYTILERVGKNTVVHIISRRIHEKKTSALRRLMFWWHLSFHCKREWQIKVFMNQSM